MEIASLKELHRWYLKENNGKPPGAKLWNVSILKAGFTGQIDFIVVHHSATNSGLLSNNQFYFQHNVVKVSHARKYI
jgi:hypothetical protein